MNTNFLNPASLPSSNNAAASSDIDVLEKGNVSSPLSIQSANVLGNEVTKNVEGDTPALRAPANNSTDSQKIISTLQNTVLANISNVQNEFDISGFSSPSVLLLLKYWAMMNEQRTADAKLVGTMNRVSLSSLDALMSAFHSEATTALFGGIASGAVTGASAIAGTATQLKGIKLQNDSAKLLSDSQSALKTAKELHPLEIKKSALEVEHAQQLNDLNSLPDDAERESKKAALLQKQQQESGVLDEQIKPLREKLDGQVSDTAKDSKQIVDDLGQTVAEQTEQQTKGLKIELSGKAVAQTGDGVGRVAAGSTEYAATTARGQEAAANTMKDLGASMREQALDALKRQKDSINEIMQLIAANNRLADDTVSAIASHTGRV